MSFLLRLLSTMLTIKPIPAFTDNYIWLITTPHSPMAYIVDPGDGKVAQRALQENHLTLAGILITHRHNDHIGGIHHLLEHNQVPSQPIPVYGPKSPSIPQITHHLFNHDTVTLFDQYTFTVFETPGHTLDHIVYFHDNADTPILFSGDTLFAAGCGRLFDGNAEQLFNSLNRLKNLPEHTQVYCTHEYTLDNLDFAAGVDPENHDVTQRIAREQEKRQQMIPTIPFALSDEKNTNPYFRTETLAIKQSVESYWNKTLHSPQEVFTHLRLWEDEANKVH